jgi:hypothetical protein
MRKPDSVKIVKLIVKLYFLCAITASFAHIITAAHKIGLTGLEAWSVPFMIDGLVIIGMVMRGKRYSKATRKLGLRVQVIMGTISLTANVYAAHNVGGVIYGVAIVTLFLAAEWLAERLEGIEADVEREAREKRSQAARKAAATRKANKAKATRKRNAQTRVLEEMIAN